MAQVKALGRLFFVYGVDWTTERVSGNWTVTYPPATPVKIGMDSVVEGTEWEWDENHRNGRGLLVRIGGWCFGVGAFEKGLAPELLNWIENEAVWLDDVEPGQIGRWKGKVGPGAEALGVEYAVRREADQDPTAPTGDEQDAARDAGGEPVRPRLRGVR